MIHNQISKLKSFPNSFPNIEYPINFVSFRYPYDITYPIIEYLAISFIRKMPRFRLGVLSREGSRPSFGTKSHGSISRVRGRHAREILRCTIYIYIDSRATRTTRYCHGKMRRKEISIIARGEPIDIHR